MPIVIRACTQGLLGLIPSCLKVSHRSQICKQSSLLIGASSRSMFSRLQRMQSIEDIDWTNVVTVRSDSKLLLYLLKTLAFTEGALMSQRLCLAMQVYSTWPSTFCSAALPACSVSNCPPAKVLQCNASFVTVE